VKKPFFKNALVPCKSGQTSDGIHNLHAQTSAQILEITFLGIFQGFLWYLIESTACETFLKLWTIGWLTSQKT